VLGKVIRKKKAISLSREGKEGYKGKGQCERGLDFFLGVGKILPGEKGVLDP